MPVGSAGLRDARQACAAAMKLGTNAFQPAVLAFRHANPSAPSRSQPECTISRRVVPSPVVDEGQLHVGGVAAVPTDVPEVAELRGGFHAVISPHSISVPSGVRSKMRPPRRGSRVTTVSGSPDAECPFGHQLESRVVHTVEGVVARAVDLEAQPERLDAHERDAIASGAWCSRP